MKNEKQKINNYFFKTKFYLFLLFNILILKILTKLHHFGILDGNLAIRNEWNDLFE